MFPETILTIIGIIATVQCEKLIIIGAGAAGIAAAAHLLESGYNDLLILEAENRIGGRVHTVPFGANVIDLGGQWCQGEEGNVVFELVAPLNLLEKSTNNYTHKSVFKLYGTDINSTTAISMMTFFLECVAEEDWCQYDPSTVNLNQSVGHYLTRSFHQAVAANDNLKYLSKDVKKGFLEFLHKNVILMHASHSLDDLSLQGEADFQMPPGFLFWEWKDKGYKTFLDVLMNNTKQLHDKIFLNKEVNKIEWNNTDNKVNVYCSDGSSYQADKVLTTVSIGVLKTKQNLFSPQLPESKQKTINEIDMGAIAKIILLFDQPWWTDNIDQLNILWTTESKQKFLQHFTEADTWLMDIPYCQRIDYQPNVLLCWLATDSVRKMEELDENAVKAKTMKLFHFLFDSDFNVSEPIDFRRTKWLTNPHFHGTYSYHGYKSTPSSSKQLGEPIFNLYRNDVVYFGGEASSHHHFGSVNGAVETGRREADKILKKNVTT